MSMLETPSQTLRIDMYYVEITPTPTHGTPPKLVPMSEAFNHTGYMSVYAYSEEVKRWIEDNYSEKWKCMGSVVGLVASQQPVYTDRLLVDFDVNPEEDAKKLTADLREIGVQYSVWSSGGRSFHVHIHCVGKEDWRVPNSQLAWIRGWADSRGATIDPTVYHGVSLFRLPGTVHSKTGKKKELIDFFEGSMLDYDLVETAAPGKPPENSTEALVMLWRLLLTRLGEGGRQFHVYKIVSHAVRLGWGEKQIMDHLLYWNNNLDMPLTVAQLEDKLWKGLR